MRSTGAILFVVLLAILAIPSLAVACTCHWEIPLARFPWVKSWLSMERCWSLTRQDGGEGPGGTQVCIR